MRHFPTKIKITETDEYFFAPGLYVYFSMIRTEPKRAFCTIGGLALILALLFGLLFTFGLATK